MYQTSKTVFLSALLLWAAGIAAPPALAASAPAAPASRATYTDDEVAKAANDIAPVRFGLGWRQGVAVSYMHFSPQKRINQF